ncbi:MAG: T9SS type A sorting domain-containing protein [Bacteroidales bacterium]|nr:T9SS type A sorting domain-containing protein [Bacteroidales bacterium]
MKKQRLLLLFLVLNICLVAQSQTTTTYDNKAILQSYQRNQFIWPFVFEDYDNRNNLCFSLTTDTAVNIYCVDNNLNVLNVFPAEMSKFFFFKLNNKLYGVRNYQSSPYNHDSTYFYANYLNGDNIFNKLVFSINEDTSKYYFMHTCFFTKNKEIAFFLLDQEKNSYKFGAKLFIIDTLGEIKASKSLNQIASNYQKIYETDSNFTILKSDYQRENILPKAYYIDKKTLEVIDSVIFTSKFYLDWGRKINDSIFVSISSLGPKPSNDPNRYIIYIVNDKDLNVKSKTKVEYGGDFVAGQTRQVFQNMIDFVNEDSIYHCCYIRNSDGIDGDFSGFIHIINFGINGELNFEYKFIYDSLVPKIINGIKATDDGGLLVMIQLLTNDCWILKFSPNGLIGLTNIETNDKESIKVYPNPAKDYIYVDIEASNFKQSEIELFDMQGKLVKKANLKSKLGNRIGVSNLNAGAYTYNVSLNGKTISGKVIIGN